MNIADSPVSIIIFTLTILISIYTIYKNQNLYFKLLLNPRAVIYEKKYYQLITSGFLHADIMHLIFNMLTFYFFGFQLESYIGSLNFFMILSRSVSS